MRISIIHNITELALYAAPWNAILRKNGNTNPYVTIDWISGWWDFFGRGREMYILALTEGDEAVGFFPLMRMKKRFHKEVQFIGCPQAGRMSLIVRSGYEKVFAEQIIRHLASQKGAVVYTLRGFSQTDACYGLLRQALGSRLCSVQTLKSSVIDLKDCDEEDYFRSRRRHYRIKKTISREKALSKLCGLRFEKAAPDDFDIIFRLHQKRWRKKIDQNGFGRGTSKEFFSWLAAKDRSSFWNVAVYLLKAGKRPIGFAYGIECNGRFTFYRIAHDDDFAFFKPGMIITKKIIELCFKAGYDKFDFSTGDEEYKKSWTDDAELIDKIRFGTKHPAAALFILSDRFEYAFHRLLKKSGALVRFKRVTAGKIRYFFSGAHRRAFMGRIGNIIRLQGLKELFFSHWFPHACKRISYIIPAAAGPAGRAVTLRTALLDEVDLLAGLTNLEAGEIVKRYAKGSRCQILQKDGRPAGFAWISDRRITDGEKLLWQPEKSGDHCCYDICLYKQYGKAVIADALTCLARQPLPGRRKSPSLILRKRDGRLIRAAEGLIQEKRQPVKPVLGENADEI